MKHPPSPQPQESNRARSHRRDRALATTRGTARTTRPTVGRRAGGRLDDFALSYRPGEGWRLRFDGVLPRAPRWLKPAVLVSSLGGVPLFLWHLLAHWLRR